MQKFSASRNLYQFVRLILGAELSDREIARRWGMDIKNFILFKHGNLPLPKIGRLEQLSKILNVSPHYLWLVCTGMSADWVYSICNEGEPIDTFSRFLQGRADPADMYFFRSIVMRAPLAVFAYNLKGRILFWNKACEKIYGMREKEISGKIMDKILLPIFTHGRFMEIRKKVWKYHQMVCREEQIVSQSNKKLPLFVCDYPVMDKESGSSFAVSIALPLQKLSRPLR